MKQPLLAFLGLLSLMAAVAGENPLPFLIIAIIVFAVMGRPAWDARTDA